jgi:hypothetical protein
VSICRCQEYHKYEHDHHIGGSASIGGNTGIAAVTTLQQASLPTESESSFLSSTGSKHGGSLRLQPEGLQGGGRGGGGEADEELPLRGLQHQAGLPAELPAPVGLVARAGRRREARPGRHRGHGGERRRRARRRRQGVEEAAGGGRGGVGGGQAPAAPEGQEAPGALPARLPLRPPGAAVQVRRWLGLLHRRHDHVAMIDAAMAVRRGGS